MALTKKQRKFCYAYAKNPNASAAAREAGYSPRTSNRQGCVLLKNPEVRALVEQIERETNESLEDVIMTRRDILIRLAQLANSPATTPGEAVAALRLLAQMQGELVQRSEIDHRGNVGNTVVVIDVPDNGRATEDDVIELEASPSRGRLREKSK